MPLHIITNKGYTLVEVLVTMSIIGVVAIPLVLFMSSVINKTTSDAVMEASSIAANYMDQTLAKVDFENSLFQHSIGPRKYVVEKDCTLNGGIVNIYIKISKTGDSKPLFTLFRGVYVPEHEG